MRGKSKSIALNVKYVNYDINTTSKIDYEIVANFVKCCKKNSI